MGRLIKIFPKLLLILFGLVLSFGQLEKITLYASLAIYVHELIMAVWLGYWCYQRPAFLRTLRQLPARLPKLFWLFLVWIGLGWLLAFFNHAALANSIFYTLRLGFYGFFAYSCWWVVEQKILSDRFMKVVILIAGFYLLYFGFLQYFFIPDTRFLQFLGWDDHYFRFISTLLDPGFTGIILILNLFLLYQLRFAKLNLKKHLHFKLTAWQKSALFAGLSLTLTLAISLTYSRATYLAFLSSSVLALAYCWWQKRRSLAFTILASLILLVVSLPLLPRPTGEGVRLERTSTIVSRTTSIQTSVVGLKNWQWVVGQGLFITSGNQLLAHELSGHNRVPDNWVIMLVTETGVVGTGLFCWLVGMLAWKTWRKNPWFWLAIMAVLIHGLFNASLIYVFVLIWLSGLALPTHPATHA